MELAKLKYWRPDIQNIVLVEVLGVPTFFFVNLIDQLTHYTKSQTVGLAYLSFSDLSSSSQTPRYFGFSLKVTFQHLDP